SARLLLFPGARTCTAPLRPPQSLARMLLRLCTVLGTSAFHCVTRLAFRQSDLRGDGLARRGAIVHGASDPRDFAAAGSGGTLSICSSVERECISERHDY